MFRNKWLVLIVVVVLGAFVLSACAQPAPEKIEIVKEVEVTVEVPTEVIKEVKVTVEVPTEVIKEV
ncbi:MAG: hypothetical protein GY759_03835, partial [Chloroflexi bacterium]|nr:hypothetical protein [Chloroflexota bacterium]